jgi:hypothetical protein
MNTYKLALDICLFARALYTWPIPSNHVALII